ncbi:unnamed protein product, partial [Ectocarpus sp. 4 AP-2014]
QNSAVPLLILYGGVAGPPTVHCWFDDWFLQSGLMTRAIWMLPGGAWKGTWYGTWNAKYVLRRSQQQQQEEQDQQQQQQQRQRQRRQKQRSKVAAVGGGTSEVADGVVGKRGPPRNLNSARKLRLDGA